MAGYRDGLAGGMLRTILIKNIGIVNRIRIIVICAWKNSLSPPDSHRKIIGHFEVDLENARSSRCRQSILQPNS